MTQSADPAGATSWWQQPPERSPRCTAILERIARGRWHPAESTLWTEAGKAAKRAGVHEWEWRNLIVHGYCAKLAADPHCPWPVETLPHCPAPVYEPGQDRYSRARFLLALCVCPEPDTEAWPHSFYHRVHWVTHDWATDEQVRLYCQCGGREDPPGSGTRYVNDDGYVCERCAPYLVTWRTAWDGRRVVETGRVGEGPAWSHLLKCDCRCCYCGNLAREKRGWRLSGHPPIRPEDHDA